jgi:site-specific recombinase XerD
LPTRPKRLPVVLTREEVQSVLALLDGEVWLVCSLLYGGGLRLFEDLQLRVKDIDFSRSELLLRDGKGQRDRVTMLPAKAQAALRQHLEMVRRQQELLGHKDVSTTMIYTHMLNRGGRGVRSPLNRE